MVQHLYCIIIALQTYACLVAPIIGKMAEGEDFHDALNVEELLTHKNEKIEKQRKEIFDLKGVVEKKNGMLKKMEHDAKCALKKKEKELDNEKIYARQLKRSLDERANKTNIVNRKLRDSNLKCDSLYGECAAAKRRVRWFERKEHDEREKVKENEAKERREKYIHEEIRMRVRIEEEERKKIQEKKTGLFNFAA